MTDVVVVGSYPPPHGGQAVHVAQLTTYLAASGLVTRVINTGADKRVTTKDVVSVDSARALFRTLLTGPRFRIAHVHVSTAADYGKLVPVAAAAAIRRFPWVVTIHSGSSIERVRQAGTAGRLVMRTVLRGASRVICVNESVRDALARVVRPERLTVLSAFSLEVPNGSITLPFEPFLAAHRPIAACVGQFEPTYGFDDAIRMLARVRQHHPDAGLLLIGAATNTEPYQQLIAGLGLGPHVHLCGNLDHATCLEALRRSSVLVRPTRFDGDALSVREALAVGTPVVASATHFRPEGVVVYRRDTPGSFEDAVLSVLASDGSPARSVGVPENRNLAAVRQLYLGVMGAAS